MEGIDPYIETIGACHWAGRVDFVGFFQWWGYENMSIFSVSFDESVRFFGGGSMWASTPTLKPLVRAIQRTSRLREVAGGW